MVAFEARFTRASDGNIYTRGAVDYNFMNRYLKVFDKVFVLARVRDEANPDLTNRRKVNGPNVSFIPLPYYVGPWQYIRHRFRLAAEVRKAVNQADAYILRIPGEIGSFLYRNLKKKGISYGAEVVADPWDIFSPGSTKFLFRPLIRLRDMYKLARQCRDAAACSYVTRNSLQKRYPPGGWTIHCSDVELPDSDIVDQAGFQERIERAKTKSESKDPWRICFVGHMGQPYKALDVLIEAVSVCVNKSMRLELTMVGGGRLESQLKEQAHRLGIADKVKFLGNVKTGSPVFEQLDKADLFVLPSRTEGLPRAMVEAMARGMPCIGSSVGGIPELLADEDIVPPADVKALADKMEEVLRDVSRLERMARRNLQTAREYRRSELSKRWVEFYKKVAEISKSGKTSE
jgi:glycosyltransferase involved in cell wall biosynthesis